MPSGAARGDPRRAVEDDPRRRRLPVASLLAVLRILALLLALAGRATAAEVELREIGVNEATAEEQKSGHFSLLADDHHDRMWRVSAPSPYFSVSAEWFFFAVDGNVLVPIERLETGVDDQWFFRQDEHFECLHAEAKFFRKIVDGKVTSFYAVQWHETGPDSDEYIDDYSAGLDDFRGNRIVYEIFLFERRKGTRDFDYPRFRKVAEKRIVVQSCYEPRINDDILQLIRDN